MATPVYATESGARLHPTILIGYGSYGRRVMRRFLLDAEPRGLLRWEDSPGDGAQSVRRLKDLVLLHVSDQSSDEEIANHIAKDLFLEIQDGPADPDDLKRRVIKAKKQLLDEVSRSGDPARHRLGLDIFVLAQPISLEELGILERILPASIQELASDVGLRQPAQGAARVNFVLVFDFENYWERSPLAQNLRQEVLQSVKRWEQRAKEGLPSFARIYLMDGHTSGGNRDEARRIEELTIFLEFVLFEGMRDHPSIRHLYQSESDQTIPLATLGIRLIERSQGLLRRLAAAYFSVGWIGYMAGYEAGKEAREQLKLGLATFSPASLDISGERQQLRDKLENGMAEIESGLTNLNVDDEDWPKQFRERLASSSTRLKSELADWARERVQQIIDSKFKSVAQELRATITRALHHESTPAPLGTVVQELKELQTALQRDFKPLQRTSRPSQMMNGLEAIDDIHRRYCDFKISQVNPARLSDYWVLIAIVASAAWTPIVAGAIADIGPSRGTSPWPVLVAPVLGVLLWLAGRYGFHRSIQLRVEQGLLTFTHPDRGWIISRVRGVLSAGQFRESLEAYADQVFQNMIRRLTGMAQRQIHRSLQKLEWRRREMEWLRNELRSFLVTYGLDPDKPIDVWNLAQNQRSGYRYSLEKAADIQVLLRRNPATKERYESTQARLQPFADWVDRYSKAFLYPVVFLEKLSHEYEDSSDTGEELKTEELNAFLKGVGEFSCAMEWSSGAGPGLDVIESYCILPKAWRPLPGIESSLIEHGIQRQHLLVGDDPSRLYLLRYQLRVSWERLGDFEGV